MKVTWKKGFDQSKVTDNNYISLAQFEYAVFFEENYQEEIASGMNILSGRLQINLLYYVVFLGFDYIFTEKHKFL